MLRGALLSCASSACTEPDNRSRPGGQGDRQGDRQGDSPVGVRGLVDDVLVGGQQGQSVLAEVHCHVSSLQASRPLLMERDTE